MTTKEKTQPNIGDTRTFTNTSRMVFTNDRWDIEHLLTCCYCTAQEWLPAILDGSYSPTGWYASEVAKHHTLAFCPTHAHEGWKTTRYISTKIAQLVRTTLDDGKQAREQAARAIRPYGPPGGINPPGIYSQRTVEWLASLPSGKTSTYWATKNRMFPELTKQQGKMNFPDLMEMRVWTIMFRHADLIWTLVMSLWHKTADHLRTPYPFSDPRFLEDPQSIANKHGGFENDPISNLRMERFRESLTHQGSLPVQWDITKDLGIEGAGIKVLTDPLIQSGQPYIKGTNTTLQQVVKEEDREQDRDRTDIAKKLHIAPDQLEMALTVNRLLNIPGWPIKETTWRLGP